MNRKRPWYNGLDIFYEYDFRANKTLTLSWSNTGNKLGWLTIDSETCFLHVWDRIKGTYDGIDFPGVKYFTFESDEQFVLLLDETSKVTRFDLNSLTALESFNSEIVAANLMACSPDGNFLAIASEKGYVKIFNKNWELIYDRSAKLAKGKGLRFGDICLDIAWHPNSKLVALAGYSATIIDVSTGEDSKFISSAGLYEVAWSPDGKWLAAASSSKTVVVWDIQERALYRVLEGHKSDVRSISFSADGCLLASQSADGMVIMWNCLNWSSMEISRANVRARLSGRRLTFHPKFPWLAHPERKSIRSELASLLLSKYDMNSIQSSLSISTVTYTSAKIVLVGESGTGKTGLGWRLANNSFKEHPSTHGQQFWLVDQLSSEREDGTQCEAVLWDLAGQPDYRLIHALFLDDVDLALILFDPTKSEDPLYGIEYWLSQLSRQNLSGNKKCPPIILVAARVDRGSSRLTNDEILGFCKARGIRTYLGTSAATGEGIPKLLTLMRDAIIWSEKPATVTTETFKRIKDQVLRLKESPDVKQSIVSLDGLRRHLKDQGLSSDFSKDELLSAVGHLATHGYVAILRSSKGESSILLVPELLNNLAASIVLEARRNLRGLGALDEQHLFQSENSFAELKGLTESERSVLLDSTVSMLLKNNVCYRETDPLNSRSYLVFPELINLKKPPFDDNVEITDDVSYSVTGVVGNVYASLVVLLGYTDRFTRTHQWRDHARYEFADGMVCGFRLENEREGELNFVLYFGEKVKPSAKSLFISLFENFLASRDVSVQRYVPIRCTKKHVINRTVIKEQLSGGLFFAHCPRCGEKVDLPEQNQTIQLTVEESRVVAHEERAARQRSVFEEAIYRIKSYASQKGLAAPRCFISYAWGDQTHERWVERFANDLMNAGIGVVLDKWDNEKIGSSVPRFVERAVGSDKVILVGTPIYRKKYQNNDPMNNYVVAAEGDMIGGRLIGTEEEKASVMPILLSGSVKTSFPDLLIGRVYGDFREAEEYAYQTIKLLTSLYEIRPREKIVSEIISMFEKNRP